MVPAGIGEPAELHYPASLAPRRHHTKPESIHECPTNPDLGGTTRSCSHQHGKPRGAPYARRGHTGTPSRPKQASRSALPCRPSKESGEINGCSLACSRMSVTPLFWTGLGAYGGLNLGTRLATACCKKAFGRKHHSANKFPRSTQSVVDPGFDKGDPIDTTLHNIHYRRSETGGRAVLGEHNSSDSTALERTEARNSDVVDPSCAPAQPNS